MEEKEMKTTRAERLKRLAYGLTGTSSVMWNYKLILYLRPQDPSVYDVSWGSRIVCCSSGGYKACDGSLFPTFADTLRIRNWQNDLAGILQAQHPEN